MVFCVRDWPRHRPAPVNTSRDLSTKWLVGERGQTSELFTKGRSVGGQCQPHRVGLANHAGVFLKEEVEAIHMACSEDHAQQLTATHSRDAPKWLCVCVCAWRAGKERPLLAASAPGE